MLYMSISSLLKSCSLLDLIYIIKLNDWALIVQMWLKMMNKLQNPYRLGCTDRDTHSHSHLLNKGKSPTAKEYSYMQNTQIFLSSRSKQCVMYAFAKWVFNVVNGYWLTHKKVICEITQIFTSMKVACFINA